ncbi:MAG: type II toxin-antitoxin system VapC family toxin [Novosphingobium sp.]
MRSVDTNVVVRWLLRDDPGQAAVADGIMDEPIEITPTVLLELAWVLMSIGRMSRDQFADAMSAILAVRTAFVQDRARVRWAIDRFRAGADWDDVMHISATQEAATFTTFDQSLGKQAGASTPVAVEIL